MKLKNFIKQFIEPNTLIRLWYKTKGGHEQVIPGDKPQMEWELKKSKHKNMIVVGVTDIHYTNTHYSEAVNITIEREQYADKPVNPDFHETITINPCNEQMLPSGKLVKIKPAKLKDLFSVLPQARNISKEEFRAGKAGLIYLNYKKGKIEFKKPNSVCPICDELRCIKN